MIVKSFCLTDANRLENVSKGGDGAEGPTILYDRRMYFFLIFITELPDPN